MKLTAKSDVSFAVNPKFLAPGTSIWEDLTPVVSEEIEDESKKREIEEAGRRAREAFKAMLLSSLQMQHVVVLTGSGTSLGNPVNGPSMGDLWGHCVNGNPPAAQPIIDKVGYKTATEGENIEALLSRCDAFLILNEDKAVSDFVESSKNKILKMCSEFLKPEIADQLFAHCTFLHRLSRRRVRDSRLKLFTTNYDVCFETAAGMQGLVVLDGFSFTLPRSFDPRFFGYDIVRRPRSGEDLGNYLEGVFQLYKLHGSVNWAHDEAGAIKVKDSPSPDEACIIFPAKGKYQQSYLQPHLELISQYLSALREPNTCAIIAGFGFNDDHLSEPLLAAIQTNPNLRLIIVNCDAEDQIILPQNNNRFWKKLSKLSKEGSDIWFLNATFQDFAGIIPDLKSLTPAQRLAQDIQGIVKNK